MNTNPALIGNKNYELKSICSSIFTEDNKLDAPLSKIGYLNQLRLLLYSIDIILNEDYERKKRNIYKIADIIYYYDFNISGFAMYKYIANSTSLLDDSLKIQIIREIDYILYPLIWI